MSPRFIDRRMLVAFAAVLCLSIPALAQPTVQPIAAAVAIAGKLSDSETQLRNGQVIVDYNDIDGIKYVVARIWIDQSPTKVWRTMANPFEFKQRICKHMKSMKVLADEPSMSLLDCTIAAVFPIPDFDYVVESTYTNCQHVDFHRVSGSFKEFRGFWNLKPVAGGTKSEVTYSLYIDPGFPAPDWLVRLAVRCELPTVLTALRDRVDYLKGNEQAAEKRTLKAAVVPDLTASSLITEPAVAHAPQP